MKLRRTAGSAPRRATQRRFRLAQETGQSTDLAIAAAGLAWLRARQGREPDCRDNVKLARATTRARQVNLALVWAQLALGDLELALGRPVAALREFGAADAFLVDLGIADVDLSPAPETVDALLRVGRHDDAASLAQDYTARASVKGQPWSRARAQRSLGLTGADDTLDRFFTVALELHAHTLDVFETACTQLAYGARLRRARRRVDARPVLRQALTAFQELGAAPWAERTAVELEATGEVVRRRECDRGRGAHLSGAAGRVAPGGGPYHPRGRGRHVPEPEDRRVSPVQGLYQARYQLACRACVVDPAMSAPRNPKLRVRRVGVRSSAGAATVRQATDRAIGHRRELRSSSLLSPESSSPSSSGSFWVSSGERSHLASRTSPSG